MTSPVTSAAMPVTIVDEEADVIGPFNRLSASQLNTWNSCPRMWYYEKRLRLKIAQVPKLFMGRAVEDVVCRVLRESPGLVVSGAPEDVYAKGAQGLLALPERLLPATVSELEEWADARIRVHWPVIFAAIKEEWSSNDRKGGNWLEVNEQWYLEMCDAALRMHISEVSDCLESTEKSVLKEWRSGHRDTIPSPDGRDGLVGNHPLAASGECTLIEAWEIARPWFVDPDAAAFSMNAVHPDFFFQGEYDLVYRWGGRTRVMDLKASMGSGDRSGDYIEQLRLYAMLWWVTHERKEQIDSLEVWYLGAKVRKTIASPSIEEMEQLENHCQQMWDKLRNNEISMEECPPEPLALRGFSAGGVATEPSEGKRCDHCDWAGICPGGSGNDDLQNGGGYTRSGQMVEHQLTPLQDLEPRLTIHAEVFSYSQVGEDRPRISVMQGTDYATVKILSDGDYPEDLAKGDMIRLIDVIPGTNYKGEIELKMDPFARIEKATEAEKGDSSLLGFRARWNVIGRVAYRTHKSGISRNGKAWSRKGLVIFDGNASIKVEGWDNQWPAQYEIIKPGSEVVVINGSLDAWAIDVRIGLEKGSTIHLI